MLVAGPAAGDSLRPADGDVAEVFDVSYESGRYGKVLRYDQAPPGSMPSADEQWARRHRRARLADIKT